MSELSINHLSAGYPNELILSELNLSITPEKITTLIGPNGSGKSTLLKTIARILKPLSGQVILNGQDIHHMPTKKLAQQLAILPQQNSAPEKITVLDLVWLGRYPYKKFIHARTHEDLHIVENALRYTNMLDMADHYLEDLSGGQRQRAWLSMALAQDTPYLLLDEPTTFLDLCHQLETLELLLRLNRKHKKTIVMVLHDVNLAARYSDELVIVSQGKIQAQGQVHDVLTGDNIEKTFGLKVRLLEDPVSKTPYFIPYSLNAGETSVID